jgi:nitrogen fixation negative regulator NifL
MFLNETKTGNDMGVGTTQAAGQAAVSALGEFLASPPEGTPPEVLEAFNLFAGPGAGPLPPRLFFEAVEQAPVAISITDAKASILYVNHAFEVLTGYPRDQILGQNQSILSNNATPDSVYQGLWRTIQGKRTWTGTLVNRTRRGGDYLAELTVTPVLDRDGRIDYFLGMHRDVTKVHALERALRQQKSLIETVLDAAPVVVAVLDDQGRVVLDNQEYKKLLGDLRGREPAELLCQALRDQAGFDPLETVLAGRGFKDLEVSIAPAAGRPPRWFACAGEQVNEFDGGARSFFGGDQGGKRRCLLLANEVTVRRREIERAQLENLRARLAEQQFVQGMREALAAAIYQIQVPLNVIHAAAAMLKGGACHPDSLAGMIDQISSTGARALATLRAALPEETREVGVVVNVNDLLRQVLELSTDTLLAAGVVVDWRPAPVLPELSVHKTQLRSVFKHLLDNAIQGLNETNRPDRELRIATRRVGDAVEVEIEDNGFGIAPEERLRVFEPFYVGWRNKRGRAGMGLALAQEIVNQHGGCIQIDAGGSAQTVDGSPQGGAAQRDHGAPPSGCRVRLTLANLAAET